MAVAEHEFNAAGPSSAGAHIFDPLVDLERIRQLKSACDYVIVLYHGGIEYHPYPSPLLQRTCRALVNSGADLVLCQHSHVIGTYEVFNNGYILYGQGNTVFGHRSGKGSWNEGLVVSITLERSDGPLARIELIPICCDQSGCVNVMAPQAGRLCLETLNARSLQTREPGFIEMAWAEFCRDLSYNQLPHALGLGLWLTRVNRLVRGRLVRLLYPRRRQLTALNVIRCAAHREAVQRCYEMSLDTRPRSLKQ
jgi:poly-gamma-glutamate synthesis protein (capsule biosynthesis protein)